MGLAVRVIPTLLKRGENLVKGERFNAWRTVGHIEQAARICGQRGVDETILLDIGATPAGTGPDFAFIERIAGAFYTPLTVGGGVRTVEDVDQLLRAGADKVAIGTAAFDGIIRRAAERYGAQAIVAAIDIRNDVVWSHGGTKMIYDAPSASLHAVKWAEEIEAAGAGEILLTSINREGTMEGYDLDLIGRVSRAVSIPVIAHGGCKDYEDMVQAVRAGASAVAAGALFQFSDSTPLEASRYLQAQGIEARVPA